MNESFKNKFRLWLRGLVGAVIAGGAHSITAAIVAPETFNLHGGLLKLLQLGVGGGFISGAFYLQKSPLPDLEADNEELTEGDKVNEGGKEPTQG